MDGSTRYNGKWNNSEKDKYHAISLICGIEETKQREKKRQTNRLFTTEKKLIITTRVGGGGRMGEIGKGD